MSIPQIRRDWMGSLLRKGRSVSGAAAAPFAQALSSLLLQITALRELGPEGFGTFALLYSGLVLLTALSSGLVGDSLTVLDRNEPRVRGGLVVVTWVSTLLAGIAGLVAAVAASLLPWSSAMLFGLAIVAFLLENLVRRLLMAVLTFWRIVVVDIAVLLVTIAALVTFSVAAADGLSMDHLFLTMVLGQVAGLAVGVALLPARERRLASIRDSEVRSVLRFGGWRGAQQAIRPASLTAVRVVVVAAVGTATFGELEGARVYTAPAMLIVNGIAGFLLASYSAQSSRPLLEMIRRADISARLLTLVMVPLGTAALLLLPAAGGIVTGGSFSLDGIAVVGWVVFAATNAIALPYASLASVRGWHVLIVGLRTLEALLSLVAVATLLFVFGIGAPWVPLALSVSPLVTAFIVRTRVLGSATVSREGS